jgi:hypothetical protein
MADHVAFSMCVKSLDNNALTSPYLVKLESALMMSYILIYSLPWKRV